MNILEAIERRHSVRRYEDRDIEPEKIRALQQLVNECNHDTGMHIQMVVNDPKAFDSRWVHYGRFSGVRNYFVIAGKKSKKLEEKGGYYGERLVLETQMMGLNTCWVALTYRKNPEVYNLAEGEKVVCVIAFGYGKTQGVSHKIKPRAEVMECDDMPPEWFTRGVDAALLAPTALNQQKFRFILCNGNKVRLRKGFGFWTKVDLGIVKYHFEVAAGKENFEWTQ
ncbi:MAG: nitroreductase [Prevotella sp.]|nr:nitroreductase [Prevotella sp.]